MQCHAMDMLMFVYVSDVTVLASESKRGLGIYIIRIKNPEAEDYMSIKMQERRMGGEKEWEHGNRHKIKQTVYRDRQGCQEETV